MSNYDSQPSVVKQVQAAINAAGYTPALVVDGIYGPKTAAGVKWFQAQRGLSVDGIIGDLTLAAALASAAGPSGIPSLPAPPTPVVSVPLANIDPGLLHIVPASMLITPGPTGGSPPPRMSFPPMGGGVGSPSAPSASGFGPMAPPMTPPAATTSKIPAWAGTAAGAAIGAAVAFPVGIAVGALAGAAVDVGRKMLGKKAPPAATMHGDMFGWDFNQSAADSGFVTDFGCEEPTIAAGDIGCSASVSNLKG